MGQDSSATLLKLIHDPEFRAQYAPNRLSEDARIEDGNLKTDEGFS